MWNIHKIDCNIQLSPSACSLRRKRRWGGQQNVVQDGDLLLNWNKSKLSKGFSGKGKQNILLFWFMVKALQLINFGESSCAKCVVKVKVTQSCPTLCYPHGPYSPWNSPGQNTGVGSLSLLQGIFPTQGSNPGLPHCRQILYQLSHRGSPRTLEWVAYPFSRGSSWPRNLLRSPALQADSLPAELSGKP